MTPAVDQGGGESGGPGAFEDPGVGLIGEDEDDFSVETAVVDGVEDRLHVGAGAGTENT
jgi:hypothetical protein